jgi:DNA repair protein RadC
MWSVDPDQRPRERLLRHGPRGLRDVELLALVLRNGRSGQSAADLARTILGTHRDLRGLAEARADVLSGYGGMGPAKAAAVVAAFELGRRSLEAAEAVPVRRAEDVVAVARREARGMRRDELLLFVTDVACRVRWTVCVATGLLTRPAPVVRAVIDAVTRHGGAGFALARLCPSPSAAPTAVDEEVLKRLRVAAEFAGLRFHEYVVVGDSDWCSVVTPPPIAPDVLTLPPPPPRAGLHAPGASEASGASGAAPEPDVRSRSRPPPAP